MPLLGSTGGSRELTGSGGYHPGVGPQDTGSSSASGSLGTTTMQGDYFTPTATTVTGTRATFDPFYSGAISYTIASGSLPPGFSINSSTGVVTGSYTASAINSDGNVYSFTVRATDASGYNSYTDRSYTITLSAPWPYRQILTTGYLVGGYQSSSLWSNANRLTHSNDTAVNLGDGLVDNYHYKSGACNQNKIYVWNGGPTGFNMRTESKSVSGNNAGGGGNNGTAFWERNYAYVTGEGTGTINKFNLSSESQANLGNGWNDHAASISGQDRGIFWGNSGQTQRVYFPTDSIANMGHSSGAHGQQKGLMAKTGYGYGGNEGSYSGGYNFRKTNISSESGAGNIGKPGGWGYGEENFGMGQNKGYMMGEHDPSGQNNRSYTFTYSTDSGSQNGGTQEPKGHGGASSGHMGWRD